MELIESGLEHKKPIIVGFLILQYAKLRKLELYCKFFGKYWDVTKFEELELITESLYLALSEHDLYDYVRPALKKEWNSLRSGDSANEFSANSTTIFSFVLPALSKGSTIDENRASSKKISAEQNWIVCVGKHIAVMTLNQTNTNLAAKSWKKERLKTVVIAACPNIAYFRKGYNVTSTKKSFRTIQHGVATYEQKKERLSYFHPKKPFSRMKYLLGPLINNYRQLNSMFLYLLVTFIICFCCHV